MSDTEKQRVLRYAELAFKAQRDSLTQEEIREMDDIRDGFSMSHEELLALAEKKLFPE